MYIKLFDSSAEADKVNLKYGLTESKRSDRDTAEKKAL